MVLKQKVCTRCKCPKGFGEFTRCRAAKDGLGGYCVGCRRTMRRDWWANLSKREGNLTPCRLYLETDATESAK